MNQQTVDAITFLQNRSSNAQQKLKDVFDELLQIMLENKQITKKQYSKIKNLLASL